MPEPQASEEAVFDRPPATFDHYDPEDVPVQPTSSPAPSSDAPGAFGDTSGADGENQDDDLEPEPVPEFDPKHREAFYGLLYIGALTSTFEWLDHEFVIRTLTTEELFEVAQAVQPYENTRAAQKAYQAATVAACTVSVDGKALPGSISADNPDLVARFNYVKQNWFGPVIDEVFSRYIELEIVARDVIKAMGNRSG